VSETRKYERGPFFILGRKSQIVEPPEGVLFLTSRIDELRTKPRNILSTLTTLPINLQIKTDISFSSVKLTLQCETDTPVWNWHSRLQTYYPTVNPACGVRVNAQSEVQMFVTLSGTDWHTEEHHLTSMCYLGAGWLPIHLPVRYSAYVVLVRKWGFVLGCCS
jgi:hypothetical protein